MEALIKNAKSQLQTFGSIRMTHYFDRNYQNSQQLRFTCIDDAISKIEEVLSDKDEDLHVPHANYF